MPKTIQKSRMFAVVLTFGGEVGAYFLHKRTEKDGEQTKTYLDIQGHKLAFPVNYKDEVIDLLVKAGLTVRFYDQEEKQWMDHSVAYGYVRAPGNRDGTWGVPTTLEDFEENYLRVV